ncbi:hypothetical protein VNO77_18247 [Canavalia gladiata]|uniref:Polygalacturonase n=1 Tax=Canavalia gladiata TaxID=3824 RepID=A0AAN9LKH1_CANGL
MTYVHVLFISTCFWLWLYPNSIHSRLDSCANEKNYLYLKPPSHNSFLHSPSNYGPCVVDVTVFGAVGNDVSDDTSIHVVPKGFIFMMQPTIFTGPCISNLTFQIDGTIVALDGPKSWPRESGKRWLVFDRINGLTLEGGGVIDGRGQKWWDLSAMSSNLTIKGIKLSNSPEFHLRFDNCIEMININSHALSRNTDGIHIENTKNVNIYSSVISNGDDCVSIGGGCYNVDIRNITCGPSHGISIGSLGRPNSRACVSNITVADSFIKHSDNGVRIKTWPGGEGEVFNVTFKNIEMDIVRNPIIIDQYYCLSKSKECLNQSSAVVFISNVGYS